MDLLSLSFAETHWYHCFVGWSLVPFEFFNINWCVFVDIYYKFSILPESFLLAACFQNQHMKHSLPSCFSIFVLTLGWKRKSFHKQILWFPIMLGRWVCLCTFSWFGHEVLWNIFANFERDIHCFMQVTYHTDTFLDKNRDYVVVEHCNLLSASNCPLVSGLFPLLPEESSRSSYKFSSVATRFKVWRSTTFSYFTKD